MPSKTTPFDSRPNMKASLHDLRVSLISEYLNCLGRDLYRANVNRSGLKITKDLQLVDKKTAPEKPINAGLLFFNERPDCFFSCARIEVVDKSDLTAQGMTEKVFTGPIYWQLNAALSYIQNYVVATKTFKEPKRAEAQRIFNYPVEAIKEALINAVYHKSYEIGEPITVTVTPEKMEITSFPGPDAAISLRDAGRETLPMQSPRNPRIGEFLKALKLVEARGTGIAKIIHAMQMNGSENPIFETDENRTFLTVILPVHAAFLKKENLTSTVKSERKRRRSANEIRALILRTFARRKELSTSALSKALGYKRVNNTLSKIIHDLVDEQVLVYTHPESLKNRNQKLRLAK